MAHQNGDRLSWGDALFLYLEREGMPMNIACVSIFEGQLSLEACIRSIAAKLPCLPRYYQRVVPAPWNIGLPSWQQDPEFDIRNHMREVTLKRGTEAELKALAGQILSTVMDRKRPLWDFTLVHGLQGDRTAAVVRLHHCLADGIAGIGVMNILMDTSPDPRTMPARKAPRGNRSPHASSTGLLETGINTYADLIQRVLTTHSELLNIGEGLAATGGQWPVQEFSRLLPELTSPTKRLFFNVTYQGPQKFAWAKIPLTEIKAIRERFDVKHNDVVVSLITATFRRYAELHGDKVRGRSLRMMVPVSVRSNDNANDLGNRISILPVTVPLGIRSPRKLLAAVHRRMEFLKRSHMAELVGVAGGLLGLVPTPLQAFAGPFASLLPITPFNLVCTNIRGPQTPLYLLGHKMLEWYPYVPIGGEMTVNCAVLSYSDVTYFGFSGDSLVAPDLKKLEKFLLVSFAELRQAAGLCRPRRAKAKKISVLAPKTQTPAATAVVGRTPIRDPEPPPRSASNETHVPPMAAD